MFRNFVLAVSVVYFVFALSACGAGGGDSSAIGRSDGGNNSDRMPSQCSDGLDNDGDGSVDFPEDSGCSDSDSNSEAGNPFDPRSFARGFAEIQFINTFDHPIGEVIVLDGIWCPPEGVAPKEGNPNFVSVAFMESEEPRIPRTIEPGERGYLNFPIWSEWVTIYVRFMREDGTLTPWMHPAGGKGKPEVGGAKGPSTVCESRPMVEAYKTFGEEGLISFSYQYNGIDPAKG